MEPQGSKESGDDEKLRTTEHDHHNPSRLEPVPLNHDGVGDVPRLSFHDGFGG
jgi:hypothetical protein